MSHAHRRFPLVPALVATAAGLGVAGCGTPVGVARIDPRDVHRALTSTVLSTGEPSQPTRNVLYQQDLVQRFEEDPAGALAALHEIVVDGWGGPDEMFALAELSFQHADEGGGAPYYLASTVYASAFLLPPDPEKRPPALDPRRRTAADLYNRGLTEGLVSPDGFHSDLRAGSRPLPFGTLEIAFDESKLVWGTRRLTRFVPVANLEVRGLATHYRQPGLGAPLAASTEPIDAVRGYDDFVEPWAKVAATAILRIDDAGGQLRKARIEATLDLFTMPGPSWVEISGQTVPLEVETTAALAYMLAESPVWKQEIEGFLRGTGVVDETTRLAALQPFHAGRIPVVLVHGTASSAGRWAQMVNELMNDARIQERYQFWLFTYDTGNPILYSAMLLREALAAAVRRFDPAGTDPALRQMVVIGHSQGGLLTRLAASDGGNAFWESVSRKSFAEAKIAARSRDLVERTVFVKPVPGVRRVIFVATPHGGSYVAGNPLAHWVARFISFPLDVMHAATDLVDPDEDALARSRSTGRFTNAVGNMTPGSSFVEALARVPLAPDVTAHSIVAVQGDDGPEGLDDGVVEYESAHVDFVESELVVRSGHSCQDNPHTIAEVRRILLVHAATL